MLPDISREERRDASRIALQSVVATLATYLFMVWQEIPHVEWAVISAIFTIQLNSDSTILASGGRIVGTFLGTAVGLLAVWLINGEGEIGARLAVVTALTSAIAAIRPSLMYGSVAAAAIALNPYAEFESAMVQAGAIVLGSVVGMLTTLTVWPELGRNRSLRLLTYALEDSRDLLDYTLSALTDHDTPDRAAIHDRFHQHMESARSVVRDTRYKPRIRHGQWGLREALSGVDRLWHGLVVLDRAVSHQGPQMANEDLEALTAQTKQVQTEACRYLSDLVRYLQGRGGAPDHETLRRVAETAERTAEENLFGSGLARSGPRNRAVQAVLFALEEVVENLIGLSRFVAERDRSQHDAASEPGAERRATGSAPPPA